MEWTDIQTKEPGLRVTELPVDASMVVLLLSVRDDSQIATSDFRAGKLGTNGYADVRFLGRSEASGCRVQSHRFLDDGSRVWQHIDR